jgi:transglutaminase-like putative cysteine protease
MKWIFFHYSTFLEFEQPVIGHQFILRCMPKTSYRQRVVGATVSITPYVPVVFQDDGFGNATQTGCITFDHTSFHYSTDGEAFVSPENLDIAPLNPAFRYPSELTKPSPALRAFFEDLSLTGSVRDKAERISAEIHRVLDYRPLSTDVNTTAAQAFEGKAGVCQDYAHIFLCLSRLAGIPARYANGLLLGDSASHAWAEVYSDTENGWLGFDPTRNRPVSEDYIRFCVGRDFSDCPIERGVFFGGAGQHQIVEINVFEGSHREQSMS